MPVFAYRARTAGGRAERGLVDAESLRSAWQQLRARGVFPTELRVPERGAGGRVGAAEVATAMRQLAVLVGANVPVVEALAAIADEAETPALREALTVARARLREGASLADALATSPRVFPALHRELVRAGEASGALPAVLARLAADGAAAVERRARLRAALVYPAVMVTTTAGVLAFLIVWVVPQVTRLFVETGATLPLATRLLDAVASGVGATWWLWLLAIALAAVAARRWYATVAGRRAVDAALLRLPVAGRIAGVVATGRVARTLATVLPNGVPLDDALALAAATAGNATVADRLGAVRDAVRRGEPLASALATHGLFAPTLRRLVATGERTGGLADAFASAAATSDAEIERTVATAIGLVEPALVLVMGVAVLALVLAILVPILTLDPLGARP